MSYSDGYYKALQKEQEKKKKKNTLSVQSNDNYVNDSYSQGYYSSIAQRNKEREQAVDDIAPITVGTLGKTNDVDLDKLTLEIDTLSAAYEKRKKERAKLQDQLAVMTTTSAARWQDTIANEKEADRINKLLMGYSDLPDMEKTLTEKKRQLHQAKAQKDYDSLVSVVNSADFKKYSTIGKNIKTPTDVIAPYQASNPAFGVDLEGEAYKTGNKVEWERGAGGGRTHAYDFMTEDEVAVYNYYLGKGDKKSAERFLEVIEGDLNYRHAESRFESMQGNTFGEILFGVESGLHQFASGLGNLFSDEEDFAAQTATQILSGMVREDLADKGPKLPDWAGGASLAQFGYDALNTGANMAPSILTSTAIGLINPAAGAAVGAGLMGASASGNAYEEAIRNGYDKDDARAYSLLIGASEATLQYVLGGIGKLGGTSAKITRATEGINNGFLRFIAQHGGKAISEATEESLQEVLDPIFQNALMGADEDIDWSEVVYSGLLGGLMGSVGGADIKLTKNERAVVQQEYQNRVSQEEESGNKLTGKQKNKIFEEVISDLDKGLISTDTIESVLGGEDYKGYSALAEKETSLTERKNALTKEIEALLDKPNPTIRDNERLAAARQELATVEQSLKGLDVDTARNNLHKTISNLVQNDTRLHESFTERARRGEDLQLDVEKYTGAAKTTAENLRNFRMVVDGNEIGLNNAYNTRSYANLLLKLSKDHDLVFEPSTSQKLVEAGLGVDGYVVNGAKTGDKIYINMESGKQLNTIVGHEITHAFEKAGKYKELATAIKELAELRGEYQARKADLERIYAKGVDIDAEVVADLVGDYLFTDEDFINNLSTKHRNVFQKIFDEIKYLVKIATAGSEEARKLEEVKKKFEQAYRDGTEAAELADDGVQYSIREEAPPKETGVAYKVFFVKDGKLYPPMVANPDGESTPMGVWLNADVGTSAPPSKTGRPQVKAGGKGTQGGSGSLAFRPGWHLGDLPRASQFDRVNPETGKKELFPENFVWAEVEYAKDVDYQEEAMSYGYTENGKFRHAYAGLPRLPENGYYRYRTNPKPDTVPWVITGAMKVNRLLSDAEVNEILEKNGVAPVHRQGGDVGLDKFGFDPTAGTEALSATEEVKFSLANDTAYMDKAIAMNDTMLRVDTDVMAKTKALREMIAKRMNAIKENGLVGLPEDVEGNTYIANSSYDGTEENTTICPRSLASEAFTDAVSEYLGRPLTVDEQIYISQDLQGRTLTPECLYCYVATDRKAYRAFLGEYITQRDSVIQKLKSDPNADTSRNGELYTEFLGGRKDTNPMYDRFTMWVNAYKNGTPMVEANHLANINKLMGDISSEFGEELRPQIVDAMKYAQSASWAKKRVNYVAYNGHILKWKQDRINKLNSHYGLRMYSFSDFHPAFVLENMQMITDASVRGLKMLGYTKDIDFVDIFAPTGMNINVSTFGFEAGGNVYENNIIGANWDKAKELRSKYPNVGVTFVATNDTLVNWALDQDWIDVVIPYHLVRTGAEVAKALNYTNYTSESADTKDAGWEKGKDKKYIAPTEHNNDKATYLEALAKNHLKPRFERFLDNPNYMKLVNECRQPASVSKPVQPIFNESAAMEALAKLETNGYYQPIGGTVNRMYEIAGEVAEAMTNKSAQYSLSDTDYMDAVNRGDTATAQKMVDEAAKNAGYTPEHLYHGTSGFGFTKIDTNLSDDGISFFVSDKVDVAQGYFPYYEDESGEYHDSVRAIGKSSDRAKAGISEKLDITEVISKVKEVMPDKYENAKPATEEEVISYLNKTWIPYAVSAATDLKNYSIPQNVESLVDSVIKANSKGTYDAWKTVADRYQEFEDIYDIFYNGQYFAQASMLWGKVKSGIQMANKALKPDAVYNNGEIVGKNVLVAKYNDYLAGEGNGVYDLYANHDNQLVIRGRGSNWNDLPLGEATADFNDWWVNEEGFEPSVSGQWYRADTRSIARYAKARGYRSVRYEDIYDAGAYGDRGEMSTVYAFFNPEEDIKSADAVTYDDADNVIPLSQRFNVGNNDIRYSLSDSDGNTLSTEQQEYFKDSKLRDDNGNLLVMYHGSQNLGFTVFDPNASDDNRSFFFSDKPSVAASYSDSTEEIAPYEGDKTSGLYKTYLNLKNPYIVDARGSKWNNVVEFTEGDEFLSDIGAYLGLIRTMDSSLGVEDFLDSVRGDLVGATEYAIEELYIDEDTEESYFTPEEQNQLRELAEKINEAYVEWDEEAHIDEDGDETAFEDYVRQNYTAKTTRQIAKEAYKNGYDGVIFKNIVDVGKFANMAQQNYDVSTVAVAFDSSQIKSADNTEPTSNPDIRYSLSMPGEISPPYGKHGVYGWEAVKQDPYHPLGPTRNDVAPANVQADVAEDLPIAPEVQTDNVDVESLVGDKDNFVSKKAMELYQEITGLKKGVRASRQLGYLLDHGYEWRSIKTALLNIRDNPNQVVNPNSQAESVAREMLGREYDNMVAELTEPTDVASKIRINMQHIQTELDNNRKLREQSNADYDAEIADTQAKYDAKKNKNTIEANNLLRRIERLNRLKNTNDANYAKRINDLEQRLEKMSSPTYKTAMQRRAKHDEYMALAENLVGDTSTWKDKKLGLSYKVNTLRRNLRDIVRDANGNRDITKADAITDEYQGNYNRNEADLKREDRRLKSPIAKLNLTRAEYVYSHMLGEFRHNPDTKLTEDAVKEYYNKHKKNIDTEKVDKAIEETRKIFDELFDRVNARLREQGMKEIPYRKGYFPHFTKPHQGFLAKLFNWKTVDNEIPTSVAGITETFNPEKSWQSFNKERKADTTDYDLAQALDTYIHGALDWIYHIEDIQKRRALENFIRYIHSDEGVKAEIEKIRNNEEYDADEAQDRIDLVYAQARNPLNNFVTDLRAGTNTLAAKKSSMDRAIEEKTNRKIYSVMTNLNNRVSANMVVGSFSSALTNFIPITQSWSAVSPWYSLRGMKDTIANTIRDDGVVNKSTFLTNRLRNEENLYRTTWDKVSDKAAFLMEAIDSFTSQTVWRSKYLQNISEGMSEAEAIADADQFAENVIAGRSRGNMPTIFDAKNPITKIFTAFQLEVANQYGYFFKDAPQDAKNKARLTKGYATAFLGAYAYNALYSTLVGRTAAFDPLRILEDLFRDMGLFGDDDEEEPEDIILNLTENVLQEVPFVGGLLGGGRIPLSSALPYSGEYGGFDALVKDISEGNNESITKEWMKPLFYLVMPMGGGQLKKSIEGLGMFSDEHPISGSYTDSGNLRFPVEKTPLNMIQAGLFGQYANANARDYFDNGRQPLKEKQIQEFIDVDIPIADYWEYREGLAGLKTNEEKIDYIAGLDLPASKKNILANNVLDRKEPVDLTDYDDYSGLDEFDFATKNPGKYAIAEAVGGYNSYTKYNDAIKEIKDYNDSSTGVKDKDLVTQYIESLPLDYGEKILLHKSLYPKDDTYNYDIVEYLDSRDDISYEQMVSILEELGFKVNGQQISWD